MRLLVRLGISSLKPISVLAGVQRIPLARYQSTASGMWLWKVEWRGS